MAGAMKYIRTNPVKRTAALLGSNLGRKSYWRMCNKPAMRYAMPNKWLQEQGLLSLADLWFQRAPLRGTA
jgi:hypothetical protein